MSKNPAALVALLAQRDELIALHDAVEGIGNREAGLRAGKVRQIKKVEGTIASYVIDPGPEKPDEPLTLPDGTVYAEWTGALTTRYEKSPEELLAVLAAQRAEFAKCSPRLTSAKDELDRRVRATVKQLDKRGIAHS